MLYLTNWNRNNDNFFTQEIICIVTLFDIDSELDIIGKNFSFQPSWSIEYKQKCS